MAVRIPILFSSTLANAFLLFVTLFLLGCTESTTKYFPDQGPHLRRITVEPNYITLIPGGTRQLTVILRDADSNLVTGRAVQWFTGSADVAQVTDAGLIIAGSTRGRTYIQASSEGLFSNPVAVNVTLPPVSLSVTPDSAAILVSGSIHITWDIRDSTNANVNTAPNLVSLDTTIALVDPSGIVTGRSAGQTKIFASVGTLVDSVAISIYSRYDSLRVTPASLTLLVGESNRFSSIAYIGSTSYYPTGVQWRVVNSAIASITNDGTVTTLDTGRTEVIAAVGNVISRPSQLIVMRANISTEYVLVGTSNIMMQVNTGNRSAVPHVISGFESIAQIRRSPDGAYAAVTSLQSQIAIIDLANYTETAHDENWNANDQPLAWSPDGTKLLGASNSGDLWQWSALNANERPRQLLQIEPEMAYHWSQAPTIADTVWLITAERNGAPYYHYAIGFSGRVLDSLAYDSTSLGVVRSPSRTEAWEIRRDRFVQILWNPGTGRMTYGVTEYPRNGITRLLNVSRDGTVAIASTQDNTVAKFSIPPGTFVEILHAASSYSHYAVNGDPFEMYGVSNTTRVLQIDGTGLSDYRWYESPGPVNAIDR